MALKKGELAAQMKKLIKDANEIEQIDLNASIDNFAEQYEAQIYDLYSKITITIPPGKIIVQTSTGPATNIGPITINGALT